MSTFYYKVRGLCAIILLLFVGARVASPEPQIPSQAGNPITLSSGTAKRLVPNPSVTAPVMCSSMLIQSLAGNTGVVYVLNAPPDVAMVKDGVGTTTVAQLNFGVPSTAPGQSFTFPSNGSATNAAGGFDWRYWGVQGSTSDTVLATCDLRN